MTTAMPKASTARVLPRNVQPANLLTAATIPPTKIALKGPKVDP